MSLQLTRLIFTTTLMGVAVRTLGNFTVNLSQLRKPDIPRLTTRYRYVKLSFGIYAVKKKDLRGRASNS